MSKDATEVVNSVGNYALISFYYLLQIGEYTVKGQRNETNQMVQLKLEDAVFFGGAKRCLRQLPANALDEDILTAYGANLKLDHHKN